MNNLHDLELLLHSDRPILSLESVEEPRIVSLFAGLAICPKQPAFCWTLTGGLARFSLCLPDRNRILALLREEAQGWQREAIGCNSPLLADRAAVDQLSWNLLGVTESDARSLVHHAIRNDGTITQEDVTEVTPAKYELLSTGGVASFEYDTASYTDPAGPTPRGLSRSGQGQGQDAGGTVAGRPGRGQVPGGQGRRRALRGVPAPAGLRRTLRQVLRRDRAHPSPCRWSWTARSPNSAPGPRGVPYQSLARRRSHAQKQIASAWGDPRDSFLV